ncbi:MAG TPA: pseudouridine synthase [Devosiaceae bacterium]|jgi:23S rRNA pseudouridine2605 synthase|nr:pseudouridine synthase [Devosiaceae bacterium]
MAESPVAPPAGDRLAKTIARSGLCSRRDAEHWIKEGRVSVNGQTVKTPAFNVTDKDRIKVDGEPLAARQGTRVWLYHKPAGLVVTEKDPEGRETIFERLEQQGLPRVVTIGRLDLNTEGLLLLTNDGGLKRVLELPATGWLRKYRVRAFGTVTQAQLDTLRGGVEIDGIKYGQIDATLEREQGANTWLLVSLREGKNREVKNVLASLGLQVNRLIRVSYGPFQLGDIPIGAVEAVKARVLRDQLGARLAAEAGADFESDTTESAPAVRRAANPRLRAAAPGKEPPRQRSSASTTAGRFRFADRAEKSPAERNADRPRRDRPGRPDTRPPPRSRQTDTGDTGPTRHIHFDDGREPAPFEEKSYGKKAKPADKAGDKPFARRGEGERTERPPRREGGDRPRRETAGTGRPTRDSAGRATRSFGDRPKRDFGDKPRPPRGDSNRPPRADGDRPRRSFSDKPKRDFGDKPRTPRAGAPRPPRGAAADAPAQRPVSESGRPPRKPYAKKDGAAPPRRPRPASGGRPTGAGKARPSGKPPGKPRR